MPPDARWSYLQNSAKQPDIGKIVDDAMVAIERDNPRLKGVLPKDYARPGLDKHRLGELIDLIGTIGDWATRPTARRTSSAASTNTSSASSPAPRARTAASSTPRSCVVRLLVEMLAPYKGRIYDPCCGSGGMFVQSEKFVEAHGGKLGDISIYGQESNATTRRLAVMNLALRGIEADFGPEHADTFRRDLHPDLRADYVLANPPFNDSDWFRKDDDVRWQYRRPAPRATPTSPGCSTSSTTSRPTAWPASSSPMAACPPTSPAKATSAAPSSRPTSSTAWSPSPASSSTARRSPSASGFSRKTKPGASAGTSRLNVATAASETLFIDARKMGTLIDRVHRELTDADHRRRSSTTYHAWRGDQCDAGSDAPAAKYEDIAGFCKSATTAEIAAHGHVLTPGRYVGAEEVEDDGEPFEEKMPRLVAELRQQFREADALRADILAKLEVLSWRQ